MDWKKLGKTLLFPHIAIMIVLVPISIVLLVASMVFIGTESPIAYISYVLSAYTLTVWCVKIPYLIKFFKVFKDENKYARKWQDDTRLRVNVSLYGSFFWNIAYRAEQESRPETWNALLRRIDKVYAYHADGTVDEIDFK